ncbi:hypothetical protein F4677DRAFT_426867 [Hypoxylon crocopeplum]|nr:hypothetical protein F4677DRAFT_426867 [Hypoxylon crocopeplum]
MSTSTAANEPLEGSRQTQEQPQLSPGRPRRWSEIEDKILKQAVALHGVSHWDDVAKLIWTKSAEECRARWAEIVPLLHDNLARLESEDTQQQQQQLRKRSMTAAASLSSQPSPLCIQEQQEVGEGSTSRQTKGEIVFRSEPPSPVLAASPTSPPTRSPSVSPILEPAAILITRRRSNTEPAARPSSAASNPLAGEQNREWLAPHPLMPGRFRGLGQH